MKNKKVSITAGILAILTLSLSLAGCAENSGNSGTSSGETESEQSSAIEEVRDYGGAEFVIGSHWALDIFQEPGQSPEGDLILSRIEELEEKYKCSFSYVTGTPEEFTTNFNTASAAGEKYADVIEANMYWWWGFQKAGYLEPLDDIADLQLSGSTWYPTYTQFSRVDGKCYGVNWLTWYHKQPNADYVLFFNQDILHEKNLESPYDLMEAGEWNWENFRSLAKKVNDPQNGVYGIGSIDRHLEMGAIRSNGSREVIQDETGRYVFGLADERTYEALEFIQGLIHTDKVYDMSCYDGRTVTEWQDTIRDFCEGKFAFFGYGSGCLQFKGFLDSMEDDYGLVPFPKGPQGTADYNSPTITGDTRVFAIPITAPDPEMSGFLLRQLAQPFEGTTADSWKETAERNFFRDSKGAEQYFRIIENADCDYTWINSLNMQNTLEAALSVTRDRAKTPAEAIAGIQPSIQTSLDQNLNGND